MRAQLGALLQAGLALKLNQINRAVSAYASDLAVQGQGIAAAYAVAAGLYAAAGVFLIAACLVGVVALFRWLELEYGLFEALGACGGALLILAAISAGFASSRLKHPAKTVPGLGARLGHAMSTNPIIPRQDQAKQRIAVAARQKAAKTARDEQAGLLERVTPGSVTSKATLAVVAGLLGWAYARRRSLDRLERTAGAVRKPTR